MTLKTFCEKIDTPIYEKTVIGTAYGASAIMFFLLFLKGDGNYYKTLGIVSLCLIAGYIFFAGLHILSLRYLEKKEKEVITETCKNAVSLYGEEFEKALTNQLTFGAFLEEKFKELEEYTPDGKTLEVYMLQKNTLENAKNSIFPYL